jgi:predicted nuclease of restriction endonuclease-like (RecB) superfamily
MSKKTQSKSVSANHDGVSSLYVKAASYIDRAKLVFQQTINVEMIKAYWQIGRDIVMEEQSESAKAEYGKAILKQLSKRLQDKYSRGFSVDVLERARKFYIIYQCVENKEKSATVSRKSNLPDFNANLSWSHYVELMSIKRENARHFYELEASKNNWTVRELRRQVDSFLFDRLTKAKDKGSLLKLACKGQEINSPKDVMKEPLVLEFLGIPEPHKLSETKLESALITNLQSFLLELGKGFAYIGRQKRLSFDNEHYYADLVFYHVILKCYVIIDLKTRPLTHGDLGQMQLYVNYFDMEIKDESDNPTVGLVLCTKKSEKMAKYMLGEKAKQIFANTYQFHLPTEQELEQELRREIKEIKDKLSERDTCD